MKVWLYYGHPSDIYPVDDDVEETSANYGANAEVLYAMTNEKAYAKKFKAIRNMKIFREVVVDITDEEWSRLSSENRDCYLECASLRTRRKKSDSPDECIEVNMLLTFMEKVDIEDNADIDSIVINMFSTLLTPLGILDEPVLKALHRLHYWDIVNLAIALEYQIDTDMCFWTDLDNNLLEMVREITRELKIDELEYFIEMYGHTLNTE